MDHPTKPTRVRVSVLLWLAVLAAIAYLSRTSITVAEETIRDDLGLTDDQMGYAMGAFFWTYALTQIPTAWLGQRFGSRWMLSLFAAASALATLQFSLAGSLAILITARMLMGVAQAGTFPCATQSISHWFPIAERARASGTVSAAMSVGQGIGVAITGLLIAGGVVLGLKLAGVGWRTTFALFALPGFVWAIGFGWWFRNRPHEHPTTNAEEVELIRGSDLEEQNKGEPGEREPTPWGRLLASPAMWLICGQQFFRAAGTAFFSTWFATYLRETRDVSLSLSGLMTALPVFAMMLAAFLGGVASDAVYRKTGSLNLARKGVASVSLLLCSVIVGGAYFVSDPLWAVLMISLGVFAATFAGPCAYSITIDMGGRHVPAVFSTMNMVGNIGAAVFAMLVPRFRTGVESLAGRFSLGGDDPAHFSWSAVLLLFAAMFLAASLCWMRLKVEGTVFSRVQDDQPQR
ncbi:MAG: MFS transporter [Planctomycetota bacterium]|nr:MAG: MFS transporter [Planctomycetota bacterium]REK24257.1 MAG: MFS transporter [Planctomycetota bacterium]REK28758.1 MAG: MFS transporter [Planctomycetota bacterium]